MSNESSGISGQPTKKGLVFVVSAPAGTGKTTLVERLINEFSHVKRCITCTTRKPRAGEVHGEDYFFYSLSEFEEKIEAQDFLEHVRLYDHYYGSPRQWVYDQLDKGCHVVLVIDTQGAIKLKGNLEGIYVFISPPSLEELRQRLQDRKTEEPEAMEKRLIVAKQEMAEIGHYDYNIINEDLDVAYQSLKSIVIAEEHKVKKTVH